MANPVPAVLRGRVIEDKSGWQIVALNDVDAVKQKLKNPMRLAGQQRAVGAKVGDIVVLGYKILNMNGYWFARLEVPLGR